MSDPWHFFALTFETSALRPIHSPPTVIMADRYTHDHPPPGSRLISIQLFFHPSLLGTTFLFRGRKGQEREREKDRYRSWEGKLVYSNQGNYLKGRRRRNRKIFWKVGKWKEKQCRWQVAPRQPAAATPTTSD